VRICPLPELLGGPSRRGGAVAAVSPLVQAHSVRMTLLPCAGRGPGRRGGAVAGGWLLVQAHSVRMGFLPCAGRGPGRRGGAVADGGRWFRPTRCASGSFLVVVLMADGWWFRPTRCAWRSFLVLLGGPGRRGGAVADGGRWFRPTRCACASPCCSAAPGGACGRTICTVSSPFGTHDAPSWVALPGVTPRSLWVGD
jgi:hypothetical protein